MKKIGGQITHGKTNTRIYRIWKDMKMRCSNVQNISYSLYGARGIKVCKNWASSFEEFYKWSLLSGYNDELTIDRKDVNGNYFPENCKWSTPKEQSNNRRNNVIIIFKGEKITLAKLSEELNASYKTISDRYRRGDRDERLFRPVNSA